MDRKNKFCIFLISCCLIIAAHCSFVSAHVLQTSGSVNAILHIEPNDDPEINKLSNFFLDFTDAKEKIDLTSCDCDIRITLDDKEVFAKTNGDEGLVLKPQEINFSYTFLKTGNYELEVAGNPSKSVSWKPFNLKYTIEIEDGTESATTQETMHHSMNLHYIHYGIFGLLFIWLIYYIQFYKPKDKNTNNKI